MDLVFANGGGKPAKKAKRAKKTKKPIKRTHQVKCKNKELQFLEFNPYSGSRWKIPESISVSDSVKFKFSILDTLRTFKEISNKISENIENIKFKFYYVFPEKQWNPPKDSMSFLISMNAKQENEWKKVRAIYFKIFKFINTVWPLIFNWQIKKCLKNCKNTEDPVTMEIPKFPVTIIDFKKRMSFVYDAKTLKYTIENRLLYSDYMFPEPLIPLNILTNVEFTHGQLISIVEQCKRYGQTSWMMDSLKSLNGDLQLFTFHNKQRLKIEAIKAFFKKGSLSMRDVVLEYFDTEADYAEMPDLQVNRFTNAYDTTPQMSIVQHWIGLTRDYYIAKELNEPTLLTDVANKTDRAIALVYKIFLHTYNLPGLNMGFVIQN
jgi:hypothetical protein